MARTQLFVCGREITLAIDNGSVVLESSSLMRESDNSNTKSAERWNGMLEFVERLIVAHAATGLNVTAPRYISGIETVLESVANEYS